MERSDSSGRTRGLILAIALAAAAGAIGVAIGGDRLDDERTASGIALLFALLILIVAYRAAGAGVGGVLLGTAAIVGGIVTSVNMRYKAALVTLVFGGFIMLWVRAMARAAGRDPTPEAALVTDQAQQDPVLGQLSLQFGSRNMRAELRELEADPVPEIAGYNTPADRTERDKRASEEFDRALLWLFLWIPRFFKHQELYRRAKAPDAYEVMRRERRSPVLLLRSFGTDGERSAQPFEHATGYLTGRMQVSTVEEQMSWVLRGRLQDKYGPLIAIGKPNEDLPELGAARFYVDDAHWKRLVVDAVRRSQLVVVRLGASDGVFWELRAVLELVPLNRVLIMIAESTDAAARRAYESLQRYLHEEHRVATPPHVGRESLLHFIGRRGVLARGRKPTWIARFQEALRDVPPRARSRET